jgi:hypothetical protein
MMNKSMSGFLAAVLVCIQALPANAQEMVQTIRGSVVDLETSVPLYAANVAVFRDSILCVATISDHEGNFRIENIQLGRYRLVASYVGYRQAILPDVIVNSAKEIVIRFELEESPMELEEISVSATQGKGIAMNKLAYVSARTFSAEESERYAGSRGDPARMASNFAGVQGNDDSNNDLVIRGNSPLGILWRMEGVNIPNPNHFGVCGTTGGPVTILNNKVLSLSDFMTGAFPAEFGNGIAGVFDLKMRNGNNETHEFSGQLGFLGTDFMVEGPLGGRGGASYLAAYRYSTLAIFHALGIDIGTDAVPKYQDLSFKLNFPAGKQGNFSIFGMGGKSAIDILASEQTDPEKDVIYGSEAMDEHFRTGMGVVGANYSRTIGSNSLLRVILSGSLEHQSNHLDRVFRHIEDGLFIIDSIRMPDNGYNSDQWRNSASVSWSHKINKKHSVRAGMIFDLYLFDMVDSIFNEERSGYVTRLDHSGPAFLYQPYVQWKYKTAGNIDLTAGLHGQFLDLEENSSRSVEPRLGLSYQISRKSKISAGTGLHSQMLPTYLYFALQQDKLGTFVPANEGLGFMKSYHTVLSWDYAFNPKMRLRMEGYYQYLFQIPVEYTPSSYSVLDEGHDLNRFFPDSLVNSGKGKNTGLELTFERFFSNSYFLMVTASLYEASRTGSDGISYDAVFNGRYIMNALGTKEFKWGVKHQSTFAVGGNITLAGGKRYTPIDEESSELAGEVVYVDELRNSMQFKPYFRADLKLNYRLNTLKATHELGLDIINITDRVNILKQTYVSGAEPPVQEVNQMGILPIFYYRINF